MFCWIFKHTNPHLLLTFPGHINDQWRGLGGCDDNINSHGKHYSHVSCDKEGDSAALIRQMSVYHCSPLIIPMGKANTARLAWVTALCVCVESYIHLFIWLLVCPSVGLHVWVTMHPSLYHYVYHLVCACVCPRVTWLVGFLLFWPRRALHSTLHLFNPPGCSTLTTHAVLSHLASCPVLNSDFILWGFVHLRLSLQGKKTETNPTHIQTVLPTTYVPQK